MYESEFKSFLGKENENVNRTYLKQLLSAKTERVYSYLKGEPLPITSYNKAEQISLVLLMDRLDVNCSKQRLMDLREREKMKRTEEI